MKMMRILLLVFSFIVSNCMAQFKTLESITFSYYGEMITHPGMKISADINIREWDKTKSTNKDSSKIINKSLLISPALGFFYHRRYQTGVFFMPEARYIRQNQNGRFYGAGIGIGYLRTYIPNTFKVTGSGEVRRNFSGHNYLATSYFVSFGKDLSIKKNIPVAYFIKPQFIYAVPNFPNGIGYFVFELGIKYNLI